MRVRAVPGRSTADCITAVERSGRATRARHGAKETILNIAVPTAASRKIACFVPDISRGSLARILLSVPSLRRKSLPDGWPAQGIARTSWTPGSSTSASAWPPAMGAAKFTGCRISLRRAPDDPHSRPVSAIPIEIVPTGGLRRRGCRGRSRRWARTRSVLCGVATTTTPTTACAQYRGEAHDRHGSPRVTQERAHGAIAGIVPVLSLSVRVWPPRIVLVFAAALLRKPPTTTAVMPEAMFSVPPVIDDAFPEATF